MRSIPEPRVEPSSQLEPALVLALKNERDMRVQTLHGAVRALTQILAVADPIDYTRALRVQQLALELAAARALGKPWEIEAAAMLAPLGGLSLGDELQRRAQHLDALNSEEQGVLASLPRLTDRLLAPIPGLEAVRALILLCHRQPLPEGWVETFGTARMAELRLFAAVLRMADEFDALVSRGLSHAEALGWLRNESIPGDGELVKYLVSLHADREPRVEVRSLPLTRLRVGMVIAEAVYTTSGQLLVNRGFEITERFLEQARNFRQGFVREPLQVVLPKVEGRG